MEAIDIESPDVVMSLDELNERMKPLMATKEFKALTPLQREWIRNLIATGSDYFLATRLAYTNAKTDHCVKTMSYQIRANDAVRAVLAIAFPQAERDERREFFDKLERRLLKGKLSIADVEICKRVCAERGWHPPNLPPGANGYVPVAQRHYVGEAFRQDNKPYRVTRTNANGSKILDAEEISEEVFDNLKREQEYSR
jgi:hypothetical protein